MKQRNVASLRSASRCAVVAAGLFVVLSWPLVLVGFVRGRGAHDQLNYHEQVVRAFASGWPRLDYSDYLSATTPGYHTVLAAAAWAGVEARWALQLVGSLFTVVLVGLLAWGVARRLGRDGGGCDGGGRAVALAVVLPFVVSMPVYYSGVWLLPDNAGWLGVLAVWLLALRRRFDAWTLVGAGAALAALVFVRQIHVWAVAMVLTAAWLGTRGEEREGFGLLDEWHALTRSAWRAAGRVALALACAAPAALLLAWFWRMWGGLTPPMFQDRHEGGNLSAPAFVLAVFGMLGVFFAPFVVGGLRSLWREGRWVTGAFALGALALALVAPTTYDEAAGRYSGLWDLAARAPAPGGRSVLVVPLAVLGGVLLAGWFGALGRRDRWVMLAAVVAFGAAQCASYKLWQRYTEPFVLMWLALAAARVAPAREAAGWRVLGPLALGAGLGLVTAASLVVARPVYAREMLAPWETEAPLPPGVLERPARGAEEGVGGGPGVGR